MRDILKFNEICQIFTTKDLFFVFVLGIVSGLPYGVFYHALSAWLIESHISLAFLGLFTFARTPYSFKFLWAPLVDHLKIPILTKLLGRRRSWMLLMNLMITLTLYFIYFSTPETSPKVTLAFACVMGLCAATYDIAYDVFRIESLGEKTQAIGVATSVLGYRIGVLVAGTITLYIADQSSWAGGFVYLSGLFIVGALFILLAKEPSAPIEKIDKFFSFESLEKTVVNPFREFILRDKSMVILSAVILYKLGESMLSSMAMPFYLHTGFSKTEIATISKVIGFGATLTGAYIGGIVMLQYENLRSLLICGTLQMLSNFMFIWQNYMGYDVQALTCTIIIENLTGGMGTVALVGYLSNLCDKRYTATQYALLSALAALCNNTLTASSGVLVESLGWNQFFILTVVISLPSLFIIKYLDLYFREGKNGCKSRGDR